MPDKQKSVVELAQDFVKNYALDIQPPLERGPLLCMMLLMHTQIFQQLYMENFCKTSMTVPHLISFMDQKQYKEIP